LQEVAGQGIIQPNVKAWEVLYADVAC